MNVTLYPDVLLKKKKNWEKTWLSRLLRVPILAVFDGWSKKWKDIKMFYPAARVEEACEYLRDEKRKRGD